MTQALMRLQLLVFALWLLAGCKYAAYGQEQPSNTGASPANMCNRRLLLTFEGPAKRTTQTTAVSCRNGATLQTVVRQVAAKSDSSACRHAIQDACEAAGVRLCPAHSNELALDYEPTKGGPTNDTPDTCLATKAVGGKF